MPDSIDDVLATLAKNVEAAVHSMYRREVGPSTAKVRTDHFVSDARDRLAALGPSASAPPVSGTHPRFRASSVAVSVPSADGAELTVEEAGALTKCVLAWLSIGPPATAKPDSKCMPPGRELVPSWRERETARQALRKIPIKGE